MGLLVVALLAGAPAAWLSGCPIGLKNHYSHIVRLRARGVDAAPVPLKLKRNQPILAIHFPDGSPFRWQVISAAWRPECF